ncbi:PocR ligand-binding domain-containing protein [Natranaerobius thermophilus]|uniref:Diguanylate cyclase and metal dependent phosphohydrolase n=1 Tax=Natranaerobius thermophilus (strain ATCC BAA-1301 / DSM 18059 / JW/NM-WN-LF) TaxID=457570 RepID=B2A7G8_NATTJ|nr:PocR ligand-binding domain-containing protein [Natranaerobius thermophilus]ACB85677.1 diguanylate cyclase and metal dependent phosphohydrolase [Natranaerobius thermophilus JW/NM-WN-LF]
MSDYKIDKSLEVGELKIEEIIDIEEIKPIMDEFYQNTKISAALMDLEGNILVSTYWQDICENYHRKHSETRKNCIQSDLNFSKGAESGSYVAYKCKNNLRDVAIPIHIEGEQIGIVFVGQFFYEDDEIDLVYFTNQAEKYGFDKGKYLQALKNVPKVNKLKLQSIINFYTKLAHLISTLGHKNVKLQRNLKAQNNVKQALRKSEENLAATLHSIGDGVIVTDKQGLITRMNPVAEQLTGWPMKQAKDKQLEIVFYVVDQAGEKILDPVKQVILNGEIVDLGNNYATLISRHGNRRQISESAAPIYNQEGEIMGVVIVFSDVTEQYKIREDLKKSEQLLQSTLDSLSAHICVLDEEGVIRIVNKSWMDFGRGNNAPLDLISPGVNYLEVCERAEGDGAEFAWEFLNGIYDVKKGELNYFELEYPCHSPTKNRWFIGRVTPHQGYFNNSSDTGIVIAHEDITARKQAEERIKYLSFHDSLTSLYNRAYLEEQIKKLDVEGQLPISLILADLNGLKLVNDSYGHECGDQLLLQTSKILTQSCRKDDIIARWGGDEFVILLTKTNKEDAEKICNRIKNLCITTKQEEIPVSITLGVSTKENSEEDIYNVLIAAEEEMYKNKLVESRSAKSNILKALLNTLGAKSFETEEHARRMQEMAYKIGVKIELTESELDRLVLLVSMHDIGKITIPEEILTKPENLTKNEWELVKKHPETGYWIARSTEEFSHIAEDILYHHEKWDGTGYPQGLEGEKIPLLARITAIVDSYDVMIYGRPYKEAVPPEQALREIKDNARTQFDPELVDIFMGVLEEDYGIFEVQ